MHKLHPFRLLAVTMLTVGLLFLPVSAFVIGTSEDLEALHPSPENSDPLPAHNTAPIATDLEFFTYKNVPITEMLDAFDPEGDLLSYRILKNPARGSLSLSEGKTQEFVYTPYENKTGKDNFTYVAVDASGNTSAPATVKLRIQKQRAKVAYADMQGNPAQRDALRLAEMNVLVGQRIGDHYFFQPEQSLSREEFLTLAMQTLNTELLPDAVRTGFSDDEAIATWARPYVASALYHGSINGTHADDGASVFLPDKQMTRSEAGVVLSRLLKLSDVVEKSSTAPTWAAQSVANLEAVGVLPPDATLSEVLTKGEAAVMLSSALDLLEFRSQTGKSLF